MKKYLLPLILIFFLSFPTMVNSAVGYQNKSEVKVDSGTQITIPVPDGFSAGDLLICCITKDDDDAITAPEGWTVIQNVAGDIAMRLWTGYRIAEVGDTEWTWTGDSEAYYGVILRYTEHNTTTPIHASGNQIGTGYDITAPSVAFTDLPVGSKVLQVFGVDKNGWEFTIPTHLTQRFKDYIAGAGGCGGAGGDRVPEWVSPTGFNDPGGVWSTEEDAYDKNTTSSTLCSVPAYSWSDYIEFTIDSISCSKVKFYATQHSSYISSISLDVYYSLTWHNIYEGAYADLEWVEKAIGSTQDVTGMRMKFYNAHDSVFTANLREVSLWNLATTGNTGTAIFIQTADEEWVGVTMVIEAESVIGWSHKWNTQTISKWNTKEIIKWNDLE